MITLWVRGFALSVRRFTAALHVALMIGVAMMLTSCGGGVGDLAGVGSGGSGLAEGTVTGFGSVYIDGERYDDSRAVVTEEGALGVRPAALKLGQRVRIRSTADNVADSIEVVTELVGPIDSVEAESGGSQWLTVLGQRVRIDKVPASASGAATWIDFGDQACTPNCPLLKDQWIQAHGTWVLDRNSDAHYLLASRVEAIDPQPKVLVSGVVRSVQGSIARLNGVAGSPVDLAQAPSAVAPAIDQLLRVWTTPPAGGQSSTPMKPERAAVPSLVRDQSAGRTVLGGEVSRVSADGAEVEIQGTRISVPPALRGTLSPSQFARLEIEKGDAGWQLKAAPQVPTSAERADVQIIDLMRPSEIASAQLGPWRLRGTLLGKLDLPASCLALPGDKPSDRVRVVVQAVRGSLPMQVRSIQCIRN
jgi:hypothetical protein